MYIQAVNSNSDKINFGAKYKIGGFTNFIPKDTLNELSGKLANFGTESDAVIIHVGPKEYTKYRIFIRAGSTKSNKIFKSNICYF